jgi:hypothetical protein
LKHAELILATARSYERATDTRDNNDFLSAHEALKNNRSANEDYDRVNFAGSSGNEQNWEKASRAKP